MFLSQISQPAWPTVLCSSFSCRLHQVISYCSKGDCTPCVFSALFSLNFLPHILSYQVILVKTSAAAFLLLTDLYFPSIANLNSFWQPATKSSLCKWLSPVCKPNVQGSAVSCFIPWEIPLCQMSQPTLDSSCFNSLPHSPYLLLCNFVVIIF